MAKTSTTTGSYVYAPLVAKLRRRLNKPTALPGAFIDSEYNLARTEGISRMSVRRAIDELVREGRLQRRPGRGVYVAPAGAGAAKANGAGRVVQIVMPNSGLWLDTARGAKEAGLRAGVQTQIFDAHNQFDSDLDAIRNLPSTAARGAIIVSLHHRRFAEVLYELKLAHYPFVLLDEALRGLEVPTVMADNYHGGYRIGQELIHRGHRRIAFVGDLHADTVRLRLDGLRDALSDARLYFDRALLGRVNILDPVGDWFPEIDRVTRPMLDRPDRPTAVFFSHDGAAADGYQVIQNMGLRIPKDISVVGFDGAPAFRWLTPSLATVRQPAREMGVAAMEILLALMDGDPLAGRSRMEAGVVSRAARTPVAVRDGSKTNGHEVSVAGDVESGDEIPFGPEPPIGSSIAAAKETRNHAEAAWHRVLPVTWQNGDSLGPAPGVAGDSTTKDTKTTDGSRSAWRLNRAAKSADEIRMADRELVEV